MKSISKIAASLVLLMSVTTATSVAPKLYKSAAPSEMEQWVDSVYNTLSMREKIAQLVIPYMYPDDSPSSVNKKIDQYIGKEGVGGIIFETGNAEDIAHIINKAQATSKVPLMVTIDAEWGVAMRMREAVSFPKNIALGAVENNDLLYEYGREVARQCKLLGAHVNFAPVLDISEYPYNPIIVKRSFGENSKNIIAKGLAYANGLEDGGVMSVAKHYPGHGATVADSHKTLPLVNRPFEQMQREDEIPFVEYINEGLGGILTAHLNIPSLGRDGIASSLNPALVDKHLKKVLQFEGLVFTDALGMKGVSDEKNVALQALKAGNDVLVQPENVKKEINAIVKALDNGDLSKTVVENACKKMLRYKYILNVSERRFINAMSIEDEINTPEAVALVNKLWAASMTVFKNEKSTLPLKSLNGIGVYPTDKSVKVFVNRCREYADVKIRKEFGDDINTVIVPITKADKKQVELLNDLTETGKNIVAVFFINPYDITEFAESVNRKNVSAVAAYENVCYAQSNAAQAVFGGISVTGKLPVSVENVAKEGTGVRYKAFRLGFGVPEEVGMSSNLKHFVDSLANVAVENGAVPGCQVVMARNGKIIVNGNYGYTDPDEKVKVDEYTMYDLASVSKATGTLPGVMLAYDRGLISLESPASLYIPELRETDKKDIKVKELLFHESGIQPAVNLFDIMFDHSSYKGKLFNSKKSKDYPIYVSKGCYGNKDAKLRTDIIRTKPDAKHDFKICEGIYANREEIYDTMMTRIYHSPLRASKKYAYSCLNFCTLMKIEQNVTGVSHNNFVQENIFEPIGAYHTMYRPLDKFPKKQIAPTEQDNMLRRQKLHGYTHDELACFSGGVQGNAALFSNAIDLAKLCQMWLQGGAYGGRRILSKATVDKFTKTKSPTCRRGLGFDKPNMEEPENSPTCEEANETVFGHLGYTGTVFWVDPANDMIFIFLCNRVNPTRSNDAFNEMNIRPDLFKAMYDNLKK